MSFPTLSTERLILRAFTVADADAVQRLAGSVEVAATTLNIPHPYEDGMAEAWIEAHAAQWEERQALALAITDADDGTLIGAISLRLRMDHRRGELGYWIGTPYWNRGYASEAASAVLDFGFGDLDLNRIEAQHLPRNPASGRVMEKTGMTREGLRRQYVIKSGTPEDLVLYSILSSDRPDGGAQSSP